MALVSRSAYTGKILHWFTLFMAAPIIVVVFNITLYLFPVLLYRFKRAFGYYFKFRPLVHIPAIAFMLGAVLSTINSVNVQSSLQVFPNYIYWGFLIIFLSSHSANLDFRLIARASFWGVIIITIYYYIQSYLPDLPIFVNASPNGYSFNMICFAPLAITYLNDKKGRKYALLLLTLLSLIQLMEGRRAGFVLVLVGGFIVLYIQKINFKQFAIIILTITSIPSILSLKVVENTFEKSNERIYGLIYKTTEIRKYDQSYLTRVAMLNKGLSIYKERPWTGVGLNNFSNFNAEINANFEGSHLILGQKNINETSAHNSYVSLLGEGGLLLLIPFIFLLLIIVFYLCTHFNSISENSLPIFVGVVGMMIHLYFISAILNVFAWYLLGLAIASMYRK